MEIKVQPLINIKTVSCFDINYTTEDPSISMYETYGMIYPILVSDDGVLLDGYKRYRAARESGKSEIETVIRPCSFSPERYVELRHITLHNPASMDILQRVSLLMYLSRSRVSLSTIRQWQNKLKLPTDLKALGELNKILEFSNDIKKYIQLFNLNYNQIRPYLRYSAQDLACLFDLAQYLKIRPVELSSINELLSEISFNEKRPISFILSCEDIRKILNHQDLNRNQKLNHFKNLLYAKRYPYISSHKKRIADTVKNFSVNPRIFLQYDKQFESNDIVLHLKLTNMTDYQEAIEHLNSKNAMHVMEQLFELL